MSPTPRSSTATRCCLFLAAAWASVGTSTLGCSGKVLPAQGELVLLLSSDMQLPDSFDTLIISFDSDPANVRRVYVDGDATLDRWFDKNNAPTSADNACQPKDGDTTSTKLSLPTTLALLSRGSRQSTRQMTMTLCKGHVPLLNKTLPITLPAKGETRTQRVALRWLCADKNASSVVGCYSCRDGTSDSSRCYGRSIAPDVTADSPCTLDACVGDETAVAYPENEYDPAEVSYYRKADGATGTCFNVLTCFDPTQKDGPSKAEVVALRADWKISAAGDAGHTRSCMAQLDSSDERFEQVNLALVLPPQTQGTCNLTQCLVPLDADPDLGWTVDPQDRSVILLPSAVCNMLDSGQILTVLASRKCGRKAAELPVCGTGNDPTGPTDGSETYGARLEQKRLVEYKFDETKADADAYFDNSGGYNLTAVSLAQDAADVAELPGVFGLAKAFDSHHFGKSSLSIPHPKSYTLALWLSLTESALLLHEQGGVLPVFSSLTADCSAGFRLNLESCGDGRVQLQFLRPAGKAGFGQCRLESNYWEFSRRTWAGGYYSPWKRGDYRHVAVSHAEDSGPTLYVDGLVAASSNSSCLAGAPATATAESGQLYLGSNANLADPLLPKTGSLQFDEFGLYDEVLAEDVIRWLYANPQTEVGPGGYRWGAWATQGSSASLVNVAPQVASAKINDLAFSSAGLFALLAEDEWMGVPRLGPRTNLADFDEAVLWARPHGDTFQFSLSADHGRRQCSWQLRASDSPFYVINLRQPSWCIDPNCSFDLSQVERASIGSDWSLAEGSSSNVEVHALSFRKRLLSEGESTLGRATRLGGTPGPSGFCWRAISYQPESLARLTQYLSPNEGISLDLLRQGGGSYGAAELTADLPVSDTSIGPRDFRACSRIRVCTPTALSSQVLQFVLQNELGQTATWNLATDGNCYTAQLDSAGITWPTSNEAANEFTAPVDSDAVRATTTRLALRFAGTGLGVTSLECCDAAGEYCDPLANTLPPTVTR